ncbi:MAG: tetratricopeptide repeat protein [Betaproteobacteria bacterium]
MEGLKILRQLAWPLLMFWLALVPAHSTGQTTPSAKAMAKARAAHEQARTKSKISPNHPGISPVSFRPDIADEAGLDAEVAAARRIGSGKSGSKEANERLARASVVLIDWVLRAEAVSDIERARHFTRKLHRDLRDSGRHVENLSRRGDLMARQAMGFLLERGILLQKDAEKSCVEFIAAAQKLAPAGWHAAQCLMDAAPEKAWAQMERAAEQGHAAAQEWMGRRFLGQFGAKEEDVVRARAYLVQSASQGRPSAQTLLAYILIAGLGGPVDLARGVRLYKVAAEKGDVNAQNNLGELHETGRGVTRNIDDAIRWYERAADQGFAPAQFNAGRLWAIGIGGKNDAAKARAFLLQAETNGVLQARQVLDWLDRQEVPAPAGSPASKP